MSDIGCNIINEYLILKKIFSYLLPEDLLSASFVCKYWHKVAKRILDESVGPLGYVWNPTEKWPNFNRQILPKVILHFNVNFSCSMDENPELTRVDEEGVIFALKECYALYRKFYTTSNQCFIGSNFSSKNHNKIDIRTGSNNSVLESVLLLNDRPGCTINTFEINSKKNLQTQTLKKLQSSDIKGIILIGNFKNSTKPFFKRLARLNAPLAGGKCFTVDRVDNYNFNNVDILGITFEGENVTTHAAVHHLKTDHDNFLKEFAEEVGPRLDDSTRLAFLFVCIDRLDMFSEDYEWKLFTKYFPNVPIYGYYCYGEYFLKGNDQEASPSAKKRKVKDQNPSPFYFHSTSYLVVTIKNPCK